MTIPPGSPAGSAADAAARRRLLLVDDDATVLNALRRELERYGFDVLAFETGGEALNAARQHEFDCAVLDYALSDITGIELTARLRAIDSTLTIVLLSGSIDIPQTVRAIRSGAEDVQTKPHSMPLLQAALERGLERTKLQRSRKLIASQITDPYGVLDRSPTMERALHRVQHAARRDLPLLLIGEAGTGKRAIAEMIHQLSAHADQPFDAVAMRDRSASSIYSALEFCLKKLCSIPAQPPGTLFLDDLDIIDLPSQQLLLRALDAQPAFRLIVSTRRDLAEDVKAGRMTSELHHRLAAFPIAIPSLRERGADAIAALAARAVQRLRIENGEGPDSFSAPALDWLCNLQWPANIPQLRDVVTESFVRAVGEPVIDSHHLMPSLVTRGIHAGAAQPDIDQWSLGAMERRQIVTVLGMSGNNRSQAARLLGITRTTLYKKLREYGLDET